MPIDLLRYPADYVTAGIPLPLTHRAGLEHVMLDPTGFYMDNTVEYIHLCPQCSFALIKQKIPSLALTNKIYLGPVPPELSDLFIVEEAIVARCRAKCWIVH